MNNMMQCKIQKRERERERVRDSGSITNTKIYFEIQACSTSPPSHRRIFIKSSTQGTSTEDLGNTTLKYTTPLSTNNNLYTRGKAQQQSPLHLNGWTLSQITITSH